MSRPFPRKPPVSKSKNAHCPSFFGDKYAQAVHFSLFFLNNSQVWYIYKTAFPIQTRLKKKSKQKKEKKNNRGQITMAEYECVQ